MKKKGLIISTVVMVIVLIASLTTATYAWFTTGATASVDTITMNVGATSKVQIGAGTGTDATGYYNETVTWDGSKWSGSTAGLGSTVTTNLVWSVDAGVGSSADGDAMDADYTKANTLYKANGKTLADLGTLRPVTTNSTEGCDVIDLDLGLRIVQGDVFGTICKMTITPNEGQTFMGMITAMHLELTVGSKTLAVNDIFDLVTDDGIHQADAAQAYTFYFFINEKVTDNAYAYGTTSTVPVTEFNLKFFISGYDEDCIDSATGTGATIDLEFDGIASDWTAETGWTQLTLA